MTGSACSRPTAAASSRPTATASPGWPQSRCPTIAVRALVAEQARLLAVRDDLKRLQIALRTRALLTAGLTVVEAYEMRKRREAALDYGDLIERARRLLAAPGQAQWVLYKLDQRIDHVLVDEAQDTSPEQWEIVERLTAEFFAGQGSRRPAPDALHRRRREAVDLQLPGCGSRQSQAGPRPARGRAQGCRSIRFMRRRSRSRSARYRRC